MLTVRANEKSELISSKFKCFRCNDVLYPFEKFGPVMEHFYHKSCFKCFICNTNLDLKSYRSNSDDLKDKFVYCQKHAPKAKKALTHARPKYPLAYDIPTVVDKKINIAQREKIFLGKEKTDNNEISNFNIGWNIDNNEVLKIGWVDSDFEIRNKLEPTTQDELNYVKQTIIDHIFDSTLILEKSDNVGSASTNKEFMATNDTFKTEEKYQQNVEEDNLKRVPSVNSKNGLSNTDIVENPSTNKEIIVVIDDCQIKKHIEEINSKKVLSVDINNKNDLSTSESNACKNLTNELKVVDKNEENICNLPNLIQNIILTKHEINKKGCEIHGENQHLGSIKLSIKYEYEKMRLMIIIHEARNLINTDKKSLSDPYARLYLLPDDKKITKKNTKIIKDNLNPCWEETFYYALTYIEAKCKTLYINLKDEKGFFERQDTQFLGSILLHLDSINIKDGELEKWYYLQPNTKFNV